MDVDEPRKETNDPFANFSLQKFNIFQDKKPESFKNYEEGGLQIFDLDGYYSLSLDDQDVNNDPIACILP